MEPPRIITLTTDFGLDDPYVSQMKGVILCRNPGIRIVDLTHAIPPQDILTAALTIHSSFPYFPDRTVHLLVVDPGVGSARAILAARSAHHFFIAPDNGILSLLLEDNLLQAIHRLENEALLPAEVSHTFHGRDIMAPLAAQLAMGLPLEEVGPKISGKQCVRIASPQATWQDDQLTGEVIRVDHFGNIRTSITAADLNSTRGRVEFVEIRGRRISLFCATYSQQRPGELLALLDSDGYLEIAANQGNAAQQLGCRPRDKVLVTLSASPCKE